MASRPLVSNPVEYGNSASFWVEYPNGLVDLTRSHHLLNATNSSAEAATQLAEPPKLKKDQADILVDGERTVRIDAKATVLVVVDMQNFFLHPDLRTHPTGLACVDPLLKVIPALRGLGVKILWVNWGLTDHELKTIPPSLIRGFRKRGSGGFGSELPGSFGRLLMRDAVNSQLYGPLQDLYLQGKEAGTDVWIHKNRMSGLWGYQTALDLYLKENGITTLLFGGVNSDQCVSGTLVDAYFRGYDCILVKDINGTTSPGGYDNVLYNASNSYGFATDTDRLIRANVV
ncbi:hypothetical protein AMATHDRAFT_72251 [Amanita thiersii Skay4041]|uniref:Isochorismatase-like domain-containing protein n=1 Tax=Amanita thiersii Skay4041 TaxID=703135 RepID=A0A2A9NV86_9AGAR|nr:hypothetical protein AMATHDRAFT_72251 [Amanita thiersii Skay4041]